MANYDLKMIKDKYGEKMMHLCRNLFPTILLKEGLLFNILSEHFDFSKSLYDDIIANNKVIDFKDYIYSFVKYDDSFLEASKGRTPKELLEEAGYILYECETEEEIQKFKKYYAPGEELCTFHGGRLNRCYVFFAVKKNVDEIKRENFDNPTRDDEYGTSVISIQFNREGTNVLSIKNRYNHRVNDPDATFDNNLDNIIPGLTLSFEETYDLDIQSSSSYFYMPNYVESNKGVFYKFNIERNNIHYCSNNVILDNHEEVKFDKAKYIVADCYIIDKVNKTIELYDKTIHDSFIDTIGKIERIDELVDKSTNERTVVINGTIKIVLNRDNQIIGYSNEQVEEIGDCFMTYNESLKSINIPNVKKIGDFFLDWNQGLQSFTAPELSIIGDCFLSQNNSLKEIDIPNIKKIGKKFLASNLCLTDFSAPKLTSVGDSFLTHCVILKTIDIPNIEEVGFGFLMCNKKISSISFPKLQTVGDYFLELNDLIKEIDLPLVIGLGSGFLEYAPIEKVNLPNLMMVRNSFLCHSKFKELKLDKLERVGSNFLSSNHNIKSLSLPRLLSVKDGFLIFNIVLTDLDLPKLESFGKHFLQDNSCIERLDLPSLKKGDFEGSLYKYFHDPSFYNTPCLHLYIPEYEGDEFNEKEMGSIVIIKDKKNKKVY